MTRLLPFIVGTMAFLGSEIAFARPSFFIYCLAAILVIEALALWVVSGYKISRKNLLLFGSQALVIASNFGFLLFTESALPRHIMAASLAVLLFLIIEQLRFLRDSGQDEKSGSIIGPLLISYAATMLWTSAGFYGLRIFFGISIFLLSLIIFLVSLFFHRAILMNLAPGNAQETEGIYYRGVWLAAIATELFIAVYTLPASLLVDGALVAIPMAVFLNLYRLKCEDRLDKNTLIKNIIFGAVALAAVLLTAKWQ